MLASTDLNGKDNDHGFIDLDALLLDKSVPGSKDPNSGSMAEMVHNRTRGSSPTNCSRSTAGSSQGEYTAFLTLARTSYLYDPRSDYTK